MKIYCSWSALKQKISSGITLYYYEYSYQYEISIIEEHVNWFTEIWKDCSNVKGLDEELNTSNLNDFETDYKTNACQL